MSFFSWLQNQISNRNPRGRGQHRRALRRFRPQMEALEDRWLPSTLTVINNLDSGLGSLRYEIDAAQSGDTIVFDKSLSGQTINLGGYELLINKNLDIEGLGAGKLAISGGHQSRVFEVVAGVQVTIASLAIENGNGQYDNGFDPGAYDGYGGGILNRGTLTLSSCTVSASSVSSAFRHGGGIDNFGGTLTVTGATLSGNSATVGGGICNEFGGTLTLTGSTLSGNTADGGGGITNYGVAIVAQSTISKNTANSTGGGIDNAGTLTLSGSTVSQNAANGKDGYGGGIYNHGILTILGSYVKSNHAQFGADLYNGGGSWSADSNSSIGKIAP